MGEMATHPTAVIEAGAKLGAGVKIGPYCVVGPDVTLGDGVELLSHVVVAGRTTIGARTRIFPFASIGHQPQDLKYHGEPSTLTVGADCMIREGVTLNPGTEGGGMSTTIGDRCAFLANSHVGHDCHVGEMREGLELDEQVLDQGIVTRDGLRAGKVDDILLDVDVDTNGTSVARVTHLITGPMAIARRWPMWLQACVRFGYRIMGLTDARPAVVPWEAVERIANVIRINVDHDAYELARLQDAVRERFIRRIPGSGA